MRRAQNADTHALKQHRLSQNISPVCSSFVPVIASDIYLKPESEKRAKNVDFHTAKNLQIQATLFSLFFRRVLNVSSDLFTIVWPFEFKQNSLTSFGIWLRFFFLFFFLIERETEKETKKKRKEKQQIQQNLIFGYENTQMLKKKKLKRIINAVDAG